MFSLVLLTLGAIPFLQLETPAANPTAVVSSTDVDLGTLPADSPLIGKFEIRNEGTSLLSITELKQSCNCCVTIDNNFVVPGECSTVSVIHYPRSSYVRSGPVELHVVLATNDPGRSELLLNVKARLVREVEVTPSRIELGNLEASPQPPEVVVTCYGDSGRPKLTRWSTSSCQIVLENSDIESTDSFTKYVFKILIDTQLVNQQVQENLVFETTCANVPRTEVPVIVSPVVSVDCTPRAVAVGEVHDGKTHATRVSIRTHQGGKPVDSAVCGDSRVSLAWVESPGLAERQLEVLVKGDGRTGEIRTEIILLAPDGESVGRIPVIGYAVL